MRAVLRDTARAELIEARDYYEAETPGLGLTFAEAVEHELQVLAELPLSGKALRGGFRRLVLTGWPYSLIYRIRGDQVVIVAIAHHSRRPGYWRDRRR